MVDLVPSELRPASSTRGVEACEGGRARARNGLWTAADELSIMITDEVCL